MDSYLLDFSRVYYATITQGMSVDETTFAIQRPRSLVEEYIKLIQEFGLQNQRYAERIQFQLEKCKDRLRTGEIECLSKNEGREPRPFQD